MLDLVARRRHKQGRTQDFTWGRADWAGRRVQGGGWLFDVGLSWGGTLATHPVVAPGHIMTSTSLHLLIDRGQGRCHFSIDKGTVTIGGTRALSFFQVTREHSLFEGRLLWCIFFLGTRALFLFEREVRCKLLMSKRQEDTLNFSRALSFFQGQGRCL